MATAKRIETILKKENPKGEEIGRALLLYQKHEKENADRPHAPLFTQDQYNALVKKIHTQKDLNTYLTYDAVHGLIADSEIYIIAMKQSFYQGYYRLFDAIAEAIRAEQFLNFLNKNNVAIELNPEDPAPEVAELLKPENLKMLEQIPTEYSRATQNHIITSDAYFNDLHGIAFYQINPIEIALLKSYVNTLMAPALRFFVDYNNFVELLKAPLNLEFLNYAFFDLSEIKEGLTSINTLFEMLAESAAGDQCVKATKVEFLKCSFKPLDFSEVTAGAKLAKSGNDYKKYKEAINGNPFNTDLRTVIKNFVQIAFNTEIDATAELGGNL